MIWRIQLMKINYSSTFTLLQTDILLSERERKNHRAEVENRQTVHFKYLVEVY